MDVKTFKRFYNNFFKKRRRNLERTIADLEKCIAFYDKTIRDVKNIDDTTKLNMDFYNQFTKKLERISATADNKEEVVKILKENQRKVIKAKLEFEEELSSFEELGMDLFIFNNKDYIIANDSLVSPLLVIFSFADLTKLDVLELADIVGYVIHLNSNFVNSLEFANLNLAHKDKEEKTLKRFYNLFDSDGKLNMDVNIHVLADFTLFLNAYLAGMKNLDKSEIVDEAFRLTGHYVTEHNKRCNAKPSVEFPENREVTINEEDEVNESEFEDGREKLNEYIKDGVVIKACSLDEFIIVLNECGFTKKRVNGYLQLMKNYLETEKEKNRKRILDTYFTDEEKNLIINNLNSDDYAIAQIVNDLLGIVDLLVDEESLIDDLDEERMALIDSLANLNREVIEEENSYLLMYLDENLVPNFNKNIDKLEKSEKKRVAQLLKRVQSGQILEKSKPVRGTNFKELYYIANGTIKLCYVLVGDCYLVVSLGKSDDVFTEAVKVLKSDRYKKFCADLNNGEFVSEVKNISKEFVNNYCLKMDGPGLTLKVNK